MSDMNMELRTDGSRRLYEQIYEHIKGEIREGKLLSGEKLPSTRSLAEYLQVSRSTVDFAYEQLLSEGYIEARPYRGYFVCPVEELFSLGSEYGERYAGLSLAEEGAGGKGAEKETFQYDFSPHAIDMDYFPFGVWRKISAAVLSEGQRSLFATGLPQGDYELRKTISRYLHSARGVNCRPEQIIVGAGNDYLLMLLEKILGRHIKIAIENPTYKRAYQILHSFAYQITTVDMDESGMKAEELMKQEVTAAYVMPSHQFPTGIVMPIGRRLELMKWAEEAENRFLIEDDYDSEFRYRGKPIPSLQASDRSGKVIYVGTFSKSIAPAIRVSYMVLPEKLLEVYRRECYFYSSTVSRIDQAILNEFIREGYFERHLNKMRKVYKGKHEKMLSLLKPFRQKFRLSGENAGLHLLLTAKDEKSEQELTGAAAAQGVRVYGLTDSLVKEDKGNGSTAGLALARGATVLLGYGGLRDEQMEKGMEGLKKAWL